MGVAFIPFDLVLLEHISWYIFHFMTFAFDGSALTFAQISAAPERNLISVR